MKSALELRTTGNCVSLGRPYCFLAAVASVAGPFPDFPVSTAMALASPPVRKLAKVLVCLSRLGTQISSAMSAQTPNPNLFTVSSGFGV